MTTLRNARRLLALGILSIWPLASMGQTFPTIEGDHYSMTINSRLDPIAINRIHAWELDIRDRAGKPLTGAVFRIGGGMPAHDHGLPTAPRVTLELEPGRYLLEGMKFQMGGEWEVIIEVDGVAGSDEFKVEFVL